MENPIVKKIIDSSRRVYNELGPGHAETTYQKSLGYELQCLGYSLDLERHLSVTYTDSQGNKHYITSDRIDIFLHNIESNNNNVILELKATAKGIQEQEIIQLKKYFRQLNKEQTKTLYGILINFPQPNSKNVSKDIEYSIIMNNLEWNSFFSLLINC